jgi:glycosyltransferase involved in cell wall biosynthesis
MVTYARKFTPVLPVHQLQPRISVIIPALNEAESLPYVLPRIPEWVHEVILVDGHSTDATIEVARQIWPGIRIIVQEGSGKGAAIRCGIKAATGDIIVLLDADGSTDPQELPAFVGALLAGADFAKGTRFIQGAGTSDMPLIRQLGNTALVVLTNILFGTRYSDITYGYNAFWRRNADYLALEIDGWANEIISNIRVNRSGLRVVEIASFEHERVAGEAKLRAFSAGWTILKAIVKEYFTKLDLPAQEQPAELYADATSAGMVKRNRTSATPIMEPDNIRLRQVQ